ncbi:MAG: phosphate acyltransferase PlsX [Alphaproteobacteria bacterium]|nr:phosphate acyltransferase PlsX [Alphaproteobacteria bacterium]
MGGDNAPACVLKGASLALVRHPGLRFLLCGDSERLEPLLAAMPPLKAASSILHTTSVIAMDEKPSVAVRQGKNSSMRLAIDAVQEGRAFGVVSAGNTGALMAMAKIVLRTLPGISRPAIVATFPTLRGECVMLDLGANVSCDARDLLHFAIMGDAYARAALGLNRPKIGLLNIGSEDQKGHEALQEAANMLREHGGGLDFHGFVEGNHIPEGTVDVVVTDGFTGNVALKMAEGTGRLIRAYMRDAFTSTWSSRLSALLGKRALTAVRDKLDSRSRNGAMFVGLNGIAVKSHGRADAYAFCNAISVAVDLAAHDINHKIIAELACYEKSTPASAEILPVQEALR